ncbi:MAG: GHKL domain-containing protein [Caulobacter sp.]|nr:GHKL domain-containing protein [Vitreoscilla sp.]
MPLDEIMALVGVAVQGTLALLMLVVWRSLKARWTLLLSAGFFAITAQYCCVAVGHYTTGAALSAPPAAINAVFGLLAHGLITWGLIDYVDLPAAWSRRLRQGTLMVFGVALIALACGGLTRGETIGIIVAFMCGWAVLFGWAQRREPRAGHGIVMLAALVYPAAMLAAFNGWFSLAGAGISLIVPHAVLGMTILTTGLVRAQASSARELAARHEVQAELERTNQSLELRVALRTAQLRETIAGLESFNRSVSHDLRGPLGGITGVSRMAREALGRGDLTAADRLLAAIARQSESSTDLVTSLLQLARSAEGAVERRTVHTDALVREVADLVIGATAAAPQVVAIEGELPDLQADPALVRQVFANLLANAVKFSASADRPHVEVGAAREPDGTVVFHVRDNGIGFAEAQVRELFVPFRRLHADRFEGHGIGLTIVRRIVERHGGRLWAEGRPGQGATFYFSFEEHERVESPAVATLVVDK